MTRIQINGHYTEDVYKAIRDKFEGKSFYRFHVTYGTYENTLYVSTSIPGATMQELGEIFTAYLVNECARG